MNKGKSLKERCCDLIELELGFLRESKGDGAEHILSIQSAIHAIIRKYNIDVGDNQIICENESDYFDGKYYDVKMIWGVSDIEVALAAKSKHLKTECGNTHMVIHNENGEEFKLEPNLKIELKGYP